MRRRRRIIYLALIGLGIAALVLDRTLSARAPARAAASDGAATQPRAAASTSAAAATSQWRYVVAPFPSLPASIDPAARHDPFEIAPVVHEALQPPAPADAGETGLGQSAVAQQASFSERHVLSAVIFFDGAGVAVIDGMSVTSGQTFDGCQVAKIAPRTVTFTCTDGINALHIPPAAPPSSNREQYHTP
jgi:hypothetical protein